MVSVVVPCYNSRQFIGRAIESVLKQTFGQIELVLVDNNSTDDTYAKLLEYQQQYPHLIKVFKEAKKGAPAARNKGLAEAKGEWIQFLDADDELMPGKIEQQLALALTNDADIISGAFLIKVANREPAAVKLDEPAIWKALISSKLGVTSANLWKREALLQVNGWDETLTSSQEYNLLFRLLKVGRKVVLDNEPLTTIHSIENSISQTTDAGKLEEILDIRVGLRVEIKNYLQQHQLLTNELDAYIDTFIYGHLMKRKILNPRYVSRKINELNLNVDFLTVLNYNAKYYAKKILFKNK